MIHHSLTEDSGTVSWGAIRRYHTDPNGEYKMRDIGYHYGVELIGNHYEILVGRNLLESGAHCYQQGMNSKAIGICIVGNFDVRVPDEAVLHRTACLTKTLMELFRIPISNVVAHKDYAPKTCPGRLFDIDKYKSRVLLANL